MRGSTYATDDPEWNLGVAVDAIRLRDPRVLLAQAEVGSMLSSVEEAVVKTGLVETIPALAAAAPRYAEPGPSRRTLMDAVNAA